MAREFSRLEKAIGILLGLDIARPGTNRAAVKALLSATTRTAPVAARAAGLTNPLALGTGIGYAVTQTPQGQDLLMAAEERGRQDRIMFERTLQDTLYGTKEKVKRGSKKKVSNFNKAVSKGLKDVKKSTSFGKKGVINNAKKAFSTVTKAVSARARGKPAPKSKAGKVAYKAAKTVYTDEILRRKMK